MMAEIQAASPNSPYVGPRPFEETEEDQQRFFGRDREASDLLSLVIAHRVILVYAESGAGKTSLLNAKLIPMLKEEEDFDVLPIGRLQGRIPPGLATEEIANLYVFNVLLSWAKRVTDPRLLFRLTLCDYLSKTPHSMNEQGLASPRVVIFDQFEELFTAYPERWRDRKQFFEQIVEALDADPLLRVAFVMREDYLAQLDPHVALLPEKLRTRYRLERLQETAALLAVTGPLRDTGRDFAPGIAEALVKELLKARIVVASGELEEVEGQYVEPVHLQVVCQRLWANLPPEVVVIEAVHRQEFGDVDRALVDFYADALRVSVLRTGIDEATLRGWFGKTLITPMGTRGTVFRDEQKGRTGDIPNVVVDVLVDQHIIRAEYRAGIRWYELTHDRFIEPILASNAEWFATWRQTHRDPLTDGAREWNRLNKDEGSLFGGAQLDEAIVWAKQHAKDVDDLEQEFLDASIALRERIAKEKLEAAQKLAEESDARRAAEKLHAHDAEERAKEQARYLKVLTALAAALVIALLIAVWALLQANDKRQEAETAQATAQAREATALTAKETEVALKNTAIQAQATAVASENDALTQRDIATSQRLAAQSISSQQSDPQLSLLLAVEAISITHTTGADDALRQALQGLRMHAILSSHTGRVNAVAFSRDGKLLATGSADGTARLWEVDSGGERALFNPPDMGSVVAVAFSPNSRWLATASVDGAARVWDVTSSNSIPIVLKAHMDRINALAYSPDGRWLVTASADKTARIWDAQSQEGPIILQGHTDSLNAVALSPESRRVATASLDGTARLWDLKTGSELAVLRDHASGVNALTFSPDGRQLATASTDGTARLWNADSGNLLGVLRGHKDSVVSVVFSPDGSRLATASADGTARIWDAASAVELAVLSGHADRVNSVDFSTDGRVLATASADGTARLWDVSTGELQTILKGHASSVNVVVFSPDGAMLATASSDSTARLWKTTGGEVQTIIRKHEGRVSGVAFSPDGSLLATGGEDGRIRLWDAVTVLTSTDQTIEEKAVVNSRGPFYLLAFSPDGRLLATGHSDGVVRLWDVRALLAQADDTAPIAVLESHKGFVVGLAFSPDGRLLATAAQDDKNPNPRLWNITGIFDKNGRVVPVGTLEGHTLGVGVAFSPDRRMLLATSDLRGNMVRLWDVSSVLEGNGSIRPVGTLRSDEGLGLVTFSPDGRLLAAAGVSGPVHVWDTSDTSAIADAGEEVAVLRGHNDFVYGLTFSPNGKLLATGSRDCTARLWDVSQVFDGNTAEVSVFRGHEDGVHGVAFSSSGDWLVTGSADRTLRMWTVGAAALRALACERATRNLTLSEWENYDVSGDYRKTCTNPPIHPSVIDAKLVHGRELAGQGNMEEGLAALRKAKELDPELEAHRPVEMARLYHEVCKLASEQDNLSIEAMDVCRSAVTLAVEADDGYHNFHLCGLRTVAQLAAVMEPACRRAGELATPLAFGESVTGTVAGGSGGLWTFENDTVQVVTLTMNQAMGELDAYLTLVGPTGATLATDDDSGDNYNARIGDFVLYETGVYTVVARGVGDNPGTYTLSLNREERSTQELARLLVEHGRELVGQGNMEEGLAALRKAKELDPSLAFVPEAELTRLLVEHGRELVGQGNVEEALAALRKAKELDPSLAFVPEAEVALVHGRELAGQGNMEEGLAALRKAKELDPELEAHRPVEMARLYHEVCKLASEQDNLSIEAMDVCRSAVTLAVEADDGYHNFHLCGLRTVAQLAAVMEPACRRAGELATPLAFGESVTGTVAGGSGGLWTFENDTVQVVTLTMNQAMGELDAYLTLVGPTGATLATDDDSGDNYNARIGDFVLYETGVYTVVARGVGDNPGTYTLSLNREERSTQELARLLVEHGRELAGQGNMEEGLAALRKAKELDPELEAHRSLEMARLYHEVCKLASEQDNLSIEAMDVCRSAVTLAVEADDGYLNFHLCGLRTVAQLAAVMEPACRRASELATPLAFGESVTGTVAGGSGGLWTFENDTVQVVTLTMNQAMGELDAYLTLVGPTGATLATDDDSGDNYNARIGDFVLYETGVYTVVARGVGDNPGTYTLSLNREERSTQELARLLVEQGRELAGQGNMEEGLAALRKAKELDPSLAFVPEAELARLLVEHGRELVGQGNVEEALAALRKAKELDPSLAFVPEAEVALVHGRELAGQGNMEEGLAALRKAKELDPELEAHRPVEMARLYHEVCKLASEQDNLSIEAMDICRSAVTLAVEADDGYHNFHLCGLRTVAQLAAVMEPACRRAGELATPLAFGESVTGTVAGGSGGLWTFENDTVQVVTLTMNQAMGELNAYLTLVGPTGATLATDDDSGDNYNARIGDFVLYETGVYTVVARGVGDNPGTYTLSLNREERSTQELARLLVEHGRELAGQGNMEEGLAALRKAKELDPSLAFVPEAEVALVRGRELVGQGNVEEGLAALRKAKELDPSLAFVPEAEVALVRGRELVGQGNVEEGLAALRKAKELDPELEAHRPVEMARLYHEVCKLASEQDNLSIEAMDVCRSAVTLAVEADDGYLNFHLCGLRTVAQLAAVMEPACRRAGELATPLAFGESVTGTVAGGSGGLWTFENDTVQVVTLTMNQAMGELNAYLTLVGPTGATLATDDDSGGNLNARIGDLVLYETGVYTIVARGVGDNPGTYTLSLNREERSTQELASLLVEHGRELVGQGNVEAALAALAKALILDPSLDTNQVNATKAIAADVLVTQANDLAHSGQTANAIALVEDAQAIAGEIGSDVHRFAICRLRTYSELAAAVAPSCADLGADVPRVEPGSPVSGTVRSALSDPWKLEIASNSRVTVTLSASDGSDLDPYLMLFNEDLELVAEHDDIESGVMKDSVLYDVPLAGPGVYWIATGRCCPGDDQGSTGAYVLEVTLMTEE